MVTSLPPSALDPKLGDFSLTDHVSTVGMRACSPAFGAYVFATLWACRRRCWLAHTIPGVRAPDLSIFLQEAADLSSLKSKLDELGVPLYAVVKEHIKNEVKDFQPYFKGEIFLDEEVCVM